MYKMMGSWLGSVLEEQLWQRLASSSCGHTAGLRSGQEELWPSHRRNRVEKQSVLSTSRGQWRTREVVSGGDGRGHKLQTAATSWEAQTSRAQVTPPLVKGLSQQSLSPAAASGRGLLQPPEAGREVIRTD